MRLFERKYVVFALSVLAAAGLAHAAGQARIQGTVTDSKGNPIPDAVITITGDASHQVFGFEKIVEVDKQGKYRALILDATRYYLLRVEAEGYLPQERPFKVGVGTMGNEFEFQLLSLTEAATTGQIELLEQPGYKELEEARNLKNAGDTEGARAKFKEAVAAKPDLLPALSGLAELNYDAGDMEGALVAARKCLDLDDESIQCLAIAANASQSLGDTEAHAAYMAQYEALNPEDPTIVFNQAATFLNKMDDDGARPLLEKCLDADPDFPECNFEYGMLLLRTGDMEGAKTYLEKYIEVAPDGPDVVTAQETIKYL
jgi:tetratricopeptide (TPR) repeat protein